MFISRRMVVVLVLFAVPSAAPQTAAGFPSTDRDSAEAACQVRVVANDVVVSDEERRAAAYQAQPAGIVPDPGQWPYFAWPDTQLGVVRTRDGAGHLFFGSDGGCHKDCNGKTPRSGSITVSHGTLDHPLRLPVADPNPAPSEFLLPTSANLPATMDYVGGGPVYRVPEGEPGAGDLLLVYHAERPANPFWSWLGLAKSSDEGSTWQDLGLIISPTHAYNPNGAVDIGDSTLVVAPDSVTGQKYFYLFFGSDTTYLSVARAPYEGLLEAVSQQHSGTSSTVASSFFHKYYDGAWDEPGIGGQQSEIFPAVTGQTDGDSQVAWSAYRHRFVAIMDNGQYIAYGESVDGLHWPAMQVLLGTNPQTAVYGYANAVGLGQDPAILGDTFYSYYTEFPQGVSWQPATFNRLTITTAASLKSIAPASITAGGAGFMLTVSGDHFVNGSIVMWNGSPRATTYVNSTQLTALILPTDIANPGVASVTVWNPAPCGGVSNSSSLSIQPPPPSLTLSVDPAHLFVGEPFTLTWSSTNATDCAASGSWTGPKDASGSEVITPGSAGEKTYSLVCDGPGGNGQASAQVDVRTPSLSLTETFAPNSLTIPTSEGSPYGFCNFWTEKASACAKQTNFGYGPTKVMQVYICLSGEVSTSECSQQPEVTGPLSAAMLKDMNERLAAFDGTGMRLLLRFTYNFGPIGPSAMDAPIDVIAKNIDQVAPIVLRHKDLIFALEAGFIGTWGEWHDSTNNNDNAAAQKLVLDKDLSYFKGLFPILVRDPGDMIQYTGTLTPEPGLGIHDDYYASNSSDAATWSTCNPRSGYCLSGYSTEQLQAYGAHVATKVMFAGEFGALYPPLQNCNALNQYSYTYHPQSITLKPFPRDIGTFLQSEGCARPFYNKVGTRIVLQSVKVIGDARPDGRLYVALTMVNDGYGRVIRERPVDLILLQDGREAGKIEIPVEKIDLRTLGSETSPVPSTFAFDVRLPEKLHHGTVTMALFIKDPAPSLRPKAAYALPLNSLDKGAQALFNPADGLNRIATFEIDRRDH